MVTEDGDDGPGGGSKFRIKFRRGVDGVLVVVVGDAGFVDSHWENNTGVVVDWFGVDEPKIN